MFVNSISFHDCKSNNYNKTSNQPSFQHLVLSREQSLSSVARFLKTDVNSGIMARFRKVLDKYRHCPINLEQQLNVNELQERVMKEHDLVYLSDAEINTCCSNVLSEFLKQIKLINNAEANDYTISMTLGGNYDIMGHLFERANIYEGLRIVKPQYVRSVNDITVAENEYFCNEVEGHLMQYECFRHKEGCPDHLKLPTNPDVVKENVVSTIYADLEEAASSILELKNSELRKVGAPKVRSTSIQQHSNSDGERCIPGISPVLW